VKKIEAKVEDAEVDEELKSLREERAELTPTDGAAEAGDQLTYDYELRAGDAVKEKAENQALSSRDDLLLGASS